MSPVPARSRGLPPGSVLQDTYRIDRCIGHGGMGEVYEASHARLAGRYAVKLMFAEIASPEAFGRFRREALVTSGLRHPSIVQVLDFNRTPEGIPYLVMEFLEGEDLAAALRRSGPMPVARVVQMVEQIASALAAAHKQGVVHRDLKPQNLFLVPLEGHPHELVKVLDFGISKVKEATSPLTRESSLIGTPQYMSPEQAQGRHLGIDGRADQFSLAVISYELLTGRCPFRGDSVAAVVYQVVYETPPPISTVVPELGPALAAVVARAMSKEAADRYPSVLAFARALAAVAAGRPEPEPAEQTGSVPKLVEAVPGLVEVSPSGGGSDRLVTTTLGTASGETLARRKRVVSMRWAVGLGLGLGAAVALGLTVPGARRPASVPPGPAATSSPVVARTVAPAVAPPAPTAPADPTARAPVPARAETVLVEIVNVPPGARVTLDGARIEPPIRLPRGRTTHLLRVEAPDRAPYQLRVDGSKDRVVRLSMARLRRRDPGKQLLDF